MSVFAAPSSANRPDDAPRFQEFEGELLVLTVRRIERDIVSATGDTFDAAVCDTWVCSGPRKGESFPGMWFMGKALLNQLTAAVGGPPILGRLVKPAGKRYRMIVQGDEADETMALALFPQFGDETPAEQKKPSPKRNPSLPVKPEPTDDDPPPF